MERPTTINLQVVNSSHIYIGWNDVNDIDYYEVERREYPSGAWQILEGGLWVGAGVADQITDNNYFDKDVDTSKTYQYRIRAHFPTPEYSDYSLSGIIGINQDQRIGYTFKNYVVPAGLWGVAGTPDDIRYTYLFGINLVAQNGQEMTDEQLAFYVESAVGDFEDYLGIIIKRRRIVTQPERNNLIRSVDWNENCDYTHEDDPYPFVPDTWRDGYGQLRLTSRPVIIVNRAELYTETDALLLDLIENEWLRTDRQYGLVSFFPKVGVEALGPFTQGSAYMRTLYGRGYPHGFKFDYDAGFESSDYIPKGLRETIMKWASIKTLASTGDGLLAGFSSSSISLDGLSESFSSTQSATSAYFGARIKQYRDEVSEWLKHNRYTWDIPIGFIGG